MSRCAPSHRAAFLPPREPTAEARAWYVAFVGGESYRSIAAREGRAPSTIEAGVRRVREYDAATRRRTA